MHGIKVAHSLPGRVRLIVPGLAGNRKMAGLIIKKLTRVKGVHLVKANPLTGRLLVYFNKRLVDVSGLVSALCEKDRPDPAPAVWGVKPGRMPPVDKKGLQEPEDLPVGRQIFNVALGGGVLVYMGVKHILYGRTPLARHPHIFNLAAAATIISGYPVFKSGLEGLARGRVNYDLVLGALALGTTLVRESIPGLLVIWLANLTALGQSLVLKSYRSYLPQLPELEGQPVPRPEDESITPWDAAGQRYGRQAVLPILGMASLSGLTGGAGGFQRALSMLLAANPSPAGLAAPTAVTAAMARAGKNGILFRNSRTVEIVSKVDTVVFHGPGAFPDDSYHIGEVLPMPGVNKADLLRLAAQAGNLKDSTSGKVLQKALCGQGKRCAVSSSDNSGVSQILAGDESVLKDSGIETAWGVYKARRLQHRGQIPLYIARDGKLAGLIGIRRGNAGDAIGLADGLRALGINRLFLTLEGECGPLSQVAGAMGMKAVRVDNLPEGTPGFLRKLKRQGHRVALVVGDGGDSGLYKEAAAVICAFPVKTCSAADVVIPHLFLLPEVFLLALQGEMRSRQNLALVQAANALGLVLAATGRLPPMLAKVYNNLISVAVGFNSLRTLPGRRPDRAARGGMKMAVEEIAAALELPPGNSFSFKHGETIKPTLCRWHALTVRDALRRQRSSLEKGLQYNEAIRRLCMYGPNKIEEERPRGLWGRLREQLKDVLAKTLLASTVVCALLGEYVDALAIVSILAVNAVLGALQEQKAEGALQALGKMTAPAARVIRSGKVGRVPAATLVPGDIVLLEQGDGVPADLRLLEANAMQIEESALTGEPYPVLKNNSEIIGCIPLLDCRNLAFMGTNVIHGRGVGLVTATGMSTEIGKIAGLMRFHRPRPTPLQGRMAEAGRVVLKCCLAASALVAMVGVLRGGSLFGMFLTGVSLAVAAIPEGLPAVITIALASGVRRMARENALVRNLPAVETLGGATLICTDKTGTLTLNRHMVQAAYTGSGWWRSGIAGGPVKQEEEACANEDIASLLTAGILCSNASLKMKRARGPIKDRRVVWKVEGDPTEGALLLAGLERGLDYKKVRPNWPRVMEYPFDTERMMMTVVCGNDAMGYTAFTKGAPEVILGMCEKFQQKGEIVPLNFEARSKVLEANRLMAGEAMRVLAVACRSVSEDEPPMVGHEGGGHAGPMVFLGLVGMIDPPRAEVPRAIGTCTRAGIKVVMITGDHPCTAAAVAGKAGIPESRSIMTGRDIEALNDQELAAAIREVRVFARVLPAQKMRLVKAFQNQGEVVAVIGDGVNDAPAVKAGDIGVVMGISGSDVTRQAGDIILADDNFASLVAAVEQGRGIHCNIRRSVRYLLSTNAGLVLQVLAAVILGLPMPMLPVQLLFLNVLGDGLPALALGVEPPAAGLMVRPPGPAGQSLFTGGLGGQILSRGLATGIVGLETYRRSLRYGGLEKARTIAMSSFAAGKLLFALECGDRKGERYSRNLIGSVALSSSLLAGAVCLPLGRRIFKTVPLGPGGLITVLGASGMTYALEKVFSSFLVPANKISVEGKAKELP